MTKIIIYTLLIAGLVAIWLLPLIPQNIEASNTNDNFVNIANRTDGSVEFSVRTTTYHGQYAPRHCYVMWICDANDNFVRTLERRAQSYKLSLIKWRAMSNYNEQNVIVTSASINSHRTHNITWDGNDKLGNPVPDGNYRVYVEFTESNSHNSSQPAGKWMMMEFYKGTDPVNMTPADNSYFHDRSLVYTPELPIEYTNFSLQLVDNSIEVSWSTASESNMLGFFIMRNEENDFATASNISSALIPATNTSNPQTYSFTDQLIKDSNTHYYWIQAYTLAGTEIIHGPEFLTATDDDNAPATRTTIAAYPNPFGAVSANRSAGTTIEFTLAAAGHTDIDIYNSRGQRVRQLASTQYPAATHHLTWNATDSNGKQVASGTYICMVRTATETISQKLVFIK